MRPLAWANGVLYCTVITGRYMYCACGVLRPRSSCHGGPVQCRMVRIASWVLVSAKREPQIPGKTIRQHKA